jgi:hypothetical protein
MPKDMNLSLTVDVNLEDLAIQMATAYPDKAIDFVKFLDGHMADWGFTMALYEYFAKLKQEYDAEEEAERLNC